ncbi:hypothetical protein [Falsiroseomonas sp. HW251]|uniref:hypothetical protein n=1 Tax=Falsiroseomonas sp. HW251 TaxID=3390998 RepID=UPI003D30FC60
MALRLAPLDEVMRPAFERLLAEAWGENWGAARAAELVAWRYYERATPGDTWVATDGTACVAMLDSYVRPYLLDGREVAVREACDWYCLPRYRPLGVGVHLMRRMMAYPEPVLSIGGTEATQAILPRLRWSPLPSVTKMILPLRARDLVANLLRLWRPAHERWARAVPRVLPFRRPAQADPPHGRARVVEWRSGMALPKPAGAGLVALAGPAELEHLSRIPPWLAHPFGLVFLRGDEPVGFSLSQLEPSLGGLEACLVHLQLAETSATLAGWVVAETASRLASLGVGMIRCLASTPAKVAALEQAGFVRTRPRPAYWWQKNGPPPPALIDAGYLRADDAMPFATLRARRLAQEAGGRLGVPVLGTQS